MFTKFKKSQRAILDMAEKTRARQVHKIAEWDARLEDLARHVKESGTGPTLEDENAARRILRMREQDILARDRSLNMKTQANLWDTRLTMGQDMSEYNRYQTEMTDAFRAMGIGAVLESMADTHVDMGIETDAAIQEVGELQEPSDTDEKVGLVRDGQIAALFGVPLRVATPVVVTAPLPLTVRATPVVTSSSSSDGVTLQRDRDLASMLAKMPIAKKSSVAARPSVAKKVPPK
jgi:hypothetical protein